MSLIRCSNLLNIGETAAQAWDEMLHCLYWLGWHSPQTRADGYCASATAFACGSFSGSGLGSSCPLADPSSASRRTMKTNPTFRIRLLLGCGQGLCSKVA